MNSKLKPCPFCGSELAVDAKTDEEMEVLSDGCSSGYYTVCCDFRTCGCGAASGYRKSKQEAIEVWNSRPNPWISVKDRLPEDDLPSDSKRRTIKVLVAIKSKNRWTIRSQERWLQGYHEQWGWRYSTGEVTHWIPLPKPPCER